MWRRARKEGPAESPRVCRRRAAGRKELKHGDRENTTRACSGRSPVNRALWRVWWTLCPRDADGCAGGTGARLRKSQTRPKFSAPTDDLLHTYAGRPTPLFFAQRLTRKLGGAKIYLKREDLLHTGAHKINNCLGQALLARANGQAPHHRRNRRRPARRGHSNGVRAFGFECVVYMGTEDMRRQELNVFRMRLLGAEVRGVDSGSRTLKDAINEAMRDWVTNVRTTHYLLGSVLGAHPYPTMVRDFHR